MNAPSLARRASNAIMLSLCGLCAFAVCAVLFFILIYLAWNGGHALNWNFFTHLPAPVGESGGGMANALLGSGKLLLLATCLGVPVGFLGGVFLAEYGRGSLTGWSIRYATDLLNGVPSIIIGIFIYTLIVLPMHHFSAVAGGAALGLMMVPIAVRTTEEFLRAVPDDLREAALALGATRSAALRRVVIPAAMSGIISGIMLDLARVAGETAPLLFTALNNQFWSRGWDQPTASLPVMIFSYAISAYPDWHRQAWAAGFVLLAAIFIINISARLLFAPPSQGAR
jgi:phosphate transport system permease protein